MILVLGMTVKVEKALLKYGAFWDYGCVKWDKPDGLLIDGGTPPGSLCVQPT